MVELLHSPQPIAEAQDKNKQTKEQDKQEQTEKQVTSTQQELTTVKSEIENDNSKTTTAQEMPPTKTRPPNDAWLSVSQGVVIANENPFSTTRIQGGGAFFKGGKLQTDFYSQLDLTNFQEPGGFLRANKAIYKGINLEGIYQFNNANNNKTRFGVTYRGRNENGGYTFGLIPLTSEGAGAEIYVSLDKKVGKRGKASAWALIDTIGKSFGGEAEYVHDLTKNLSAFVQARYGGNFNNPSVSGGGGVRLSLR